MARKNQFAEPHFHNETAARAWFEAARWPNGPICPKCKNAKAYATKKPGVYRCAASTCRKDFTVMTGTVMERSHVKLPQWAAAFHMYASSKKGFSALQLSRELGVEYNTAWFMHHRIMEAMRRGGLDVPSMGSGGGPVEMDESYVGRIKGVRVKCGGMRHKYPVLTLLDRRTGEARSFHIETATSADITPIARANISKEARLITDQATWYKKLGTEFASHETVDHRANEYVRGDVTTNTVESYFSVFKSGMRGVYQVCGEKHLHRYLAEFDFRHNYRASLGYNDSDRTLAAVRGGDGKRLTYHQPH
jgi:transposase-like protein